ncbi:hypothetical protein PHYBLDRAFT_171051 [Phycomyces blakesleeanus NRRL 1555(-)]|uniref:Transposase domain-containing protein n=1 Tax=Phycomyces blakesleeanus (strain ATCC 8743b / DSM 1359 / FGSC 10004 / NBRC 33097 / NRRL 1555) TaxID=763407 RepID=A0A162TU10_PHYB8|nr:hypothetical protein PHYBLDRAFT_171051 [Phycomyces blakesleeanus NRRL 1555(-)]OAD70992.1 hypothetical protein PHYBLDRAFT_171051 [Phycomyces blakesleeanus NRRL 1555(-)]|eukprot:XP_018289032.1 hypothetical protein PHYBLDRAFT_171051 [Phycomyces blakesleeanus NRRL 1555(-)]
MSNNQKKVSYVICKCPDCTKLDSCGKKQKRQNAQRHYEKHIVPVAKDNAMDVPEEHFDDMEVDSIDSDNDNDYDYENEGEGEYEDENEEQNIEFDQEVDLPLSQEESIFTAKDTFTGAFVVDRDEIEEGNTGFVFEQEENFDETSGTSIVESARPSSFDNMPLYIRFVAVFIVIFHLTFLVESGGSILIEFCNTLLSLCDMSGALLLTINSLKHKTGFNMATDGMTVYIACSQCHSIYPPETSQRVCTFKKFSQSAICNNNLFKVSTGNHSLPAMANALNNTEQTCLEKENGTRWSELHWLSYFDLVRFTVIDPIHNLYLGTAKQMIQIWRECNYINEKNQLTMQELANGIVVPCGYAPKNLENWILFVDACHLLTKPLINDKEIDEAHSKLQLFCTRFQTLYGKSAVTLNMHLHLHLGECVHDFGPIYAFWLFSFKRYNGLLKNIETNQKGGFESMMMKRFLEITYIGNFIQSFVNHLPQFAIDFLHRISNSQDQLAALHPSSTASTFSLSDFVEYSLNSCHSALGCELLPPSVFPIKLNQRITMCKGHYECLLEFYRHAYGSHDLFGHYSNCESNQIFVNNQIEKIKQISLLGQEYSSGSYFHAYYLENNSEDKAAFSGCILYLFQHLITINKTVITHTFAFVEWYSSYSLGSYQPMLNEGIELWNELSSVLNYECIIPVHCLYSPIAIAKYRFTITSEFKRLVIPLPQKIEA